MSTEPTLQSDHQDIFDDLFWVIKRNYQLRWISVFSGKRNGGRNWNPFWRLRRPESRFAHKWASLRFSNASHTVAFFPSNFFGQKNWTELESNQRHKDFQTCESASARFLE
jgi:hypothetical protein